MSWCPGCGGILGRECFNPAECLAIAQDMAQEPERRARQEEEEAYYREEEEAYYAAQEDEERRRREALHDPTSDAYYSDGAREARIDGGLEKP